MKSYISNIVVSVFLALISIASSAQDISVTAAVDRDKILIGEPVRLTLEVVLPGETPVQWFNTDTIPHFEFIEKTKVDSSVKGVYTQVLTITSFDSGLNVIPPFRLLLNGTSYVTDSIPITVSFSSFDPNRDYHDIKDILPVKPMSPYLRWLLIAAGIVLISLLAWYFIRKYRQKRVTPSALFDATKAFEEAMQALNDLEKQPLPEKQYYTRLNDILRWFVYRKTRIATMQKTNEEFILQLEKTGLPQEDFISLAQALRMSDAVKFAKFIPTKIENERNLQVIRKSIEQLNKQNNSAV